MSGLPHAGSLDPWLGARPGKPLILEQPKLDVVDERIRATVGEVWPASDAGFVYDDERPIGRRDW